jgi:hypothetical protein
VAKVDAGQLERVLGSEWQAMSYVQTATRVRPLETSAKFARTLLRYMDTTRPETPGEGLAALAARQTNGSR